MMRPTFETIHNDFVDFDATCSHYDYAFSEYMKNNGYTNDPTLPDRKRQPKNDTPRVKQKSQPRNR